MRFTVVGSQSECIEQLEEIKNFLLGSIHSEIMQFRMQEAEIILLPKKVIDEEQKDNRAITTQDNSCPDNPQEIRKE